MAHIAVWSWYPVNKAQEVGAVFTKREQAPSKIPMKISGPFMWVTPDGIATFADHEVPNDKLYEASIRITAVMGEYAGIEGYKWESRVVATATEGADMQKVITELRGT